MYATKIVFKIKIQAIYSKIIESASKIYSEIFYKSLNIQDGCYAVVYNMHSKKIEIKSFISDIKANKILWIKKYKECNFRGALD